MLACPCYKNMSVLAKCLTRLHSAAGDSCSWPMTILLTPPPPLWTPPLLVNCVNEVGWVMVVISYCSHSTSLLLARTTLAGSLRIKTLCSRKTWYLVFVLFLTSPLSFCVCVYRHGDDLIVTPFAQVSGLPSVTQREYDIITVGTVRVQLLTVIS